MCGQRPSPPFFHITDQGNHPMEDAFPTTIEIIKLFLFLGLCKLGGSMKSDCYWNGMLTKESISNVKLILQFLVKQSFHNVIYNLVQQNRLKCLVVPALTSRFRMRCMKMQQLHFQILLTVRLISHDFLFSAEQNSKH